MFFCFNLKFIWLLSHLGIYVSQLDKRVQINAVSWEPLKRQTNTKAKGLPELVEKWKGLATKYWTQK
jgi:hypothetical protein